MVIHHHSLHCCVILALPRPIALHRVLSSSTNCRASQLCSTAKRAAQVADSHNAWCPQANLHSYRASCQLWHLNNRKSTNTAQICIPILTGVGNVIVASILGAPKSLFLLSLLEAYSYECQSFAIAWGQHDQQPKHIKPAEKNPKGEPKLCSGVHSAKGQQQFHSMRCISAKTNSLWFWVCLHDCRLFHDVEIFSEGLVKSMPNCAAILAQSHSENAYKKDQNSTRQHC